MTATAPRLFLIDGSGYIFRAYHALPPLTRASDGAPVGAVAGFCNMLWKFLGDMQAGEAPTHLAVIFDASEKTFRNQLYPAYKAHRPPTPEDLVPQFPLMRDAVRAFNIACVEMNGFEADDLIATYARQAAAEGATVKIVSSDKDLMQLVTDGVIALYDPMKQKPLGLEAVMEKFGVTPDKVIDAQALIGDSSDNVPGAPGIGPKTAAELIAQFGSLEQVIARAGEIKQPKRREAIQNNVEQIRLSKMLVTLKDDVPVTAPWRDFAVRAPEQAALLAFLDAMEFRTLGRRVREHGAKPQGGAAPAPAQSFAPPSPPANEAAAVNYDAYVTVRELGALETWIARARAAGVVAVDTETDALDATRAGLVGVSLALGSNDACYIPLAHKRPKLSSESGDLLGAMLPLDGGGVAEGDGGGAPSTRKPKVSVGSPPQSALRADSSPMEGEHGADYTQIPMHAAIAALKPLLEDPSVLKVGQNIKYDLSVFARHGVEVAPFDDTMLISYVLAGGLHNHGMDELSQLHLGHKPITFADVAGKGKAQVSFDLVPIERAAAYAAEDADVTLRLWRALKPRLAQERLITVYETLERPLPPVLAAMERAGVKIDAGVLARLSLDFAQRMGVFEQTAHRLAGRDFNIASPKQVGEILFDEMGLPGGAKTKTGAWSTDASVLDDLAAQGHELAKTLLDWRQLAKLRSTYTEALREAVNPETGRVHTSFALSSTTTGRLSSNDPNLQNIPIRTEEGRRIREAFIAEPGHVLISADYSQIELRLLAHVADIASLKQAFADGLDIHAMTASEMFGVPIKDMPSDIRRQAKAINFGIIYGISAFGLARNLGIGRGEADAYIKKYFERFPGIRAYMEETKAYARANGFVKTIFGRRIWVAGIASKNAQERNFAERQAINAPLQGASADIIRRAMVRMADALARAGLKARMLLQVHDELVFEASAAEAEAVMALAKQVMQAAPESAVTLSVPLTVEANAGATWAAAH